MSKSLKIFLLVVVSFLTSFPLSANGTFFSIEKSGDRVEDLVNGGGDLVRGVKRSDFTSSIKEFATDSKLADDAWAFFKNEEWSGLEDLFKNRKLNGYKGDYYPPNDGFIKIKIEPLKVGTKLDRYGGVIDETTGQLKDGGKFFANKGEPLTNRALPAGSDKKVYSQYEVIKEIPNTKQGAAIPWFRQKGKGLQYRVTDGVDDLIEGGYIRRVSTTASAPKVISESTQFNRGSRFFKIAQGDASAGWKHIYDRHIDPTRFPKKTKFIEGLSEYEVKNLLSVTLKHGSESKFEGLSVFEYRTKIRGVYKKYRATINVDGTVKTFHPLE